MTEGRTYQSVPLRRYSEAMRIVNLEFGPAARRRSIAGLFRQTQHTLSRSFTTYYVLQTLVWGNQGGCSNGEYTSIVIYDVSDATIACRGDGRGPQSSEGMYLQWRR